MELKDGKTVGFYPGIGHQVGLHCRLSAMRYLHGVDKNAVKTMNVGVYKQVAFVIARRLIDREIEGLQRQPARRNKVL